MKSRLTLGQVTVLFFAGFLFIFTGVYYDKIILSTGIFILFLASIFLTMVKTDQNEKRK